jgi:hypothetical protein
LPSCDPAAIGPGCQINPSAVELWFNQNTADGGDGYLNFAAVDGAMYWRQAGSDAPDVWGYWPTPPYAGKGHFELHEFTSAVHPNSGFTSTTGPPSFSAPSCGSVSWSSRPNVWLNSTLAYNRASLGLENWNVSNAAHELGHVLGLNDNHNDACADANLMEGSSYHAYADCTIYRPTAGDVRAVDALYD